MTTLAILASIFSICLFVGSMFAVDYLYDRGKISRSMGWALLILATIVCVWSALFFAG
jgi:hypothetical protein